jgi:hypothetical protein
MIIKDEGISTLHMTPPMLVPAVHLPSIVHVESTP